MFCSCRSSHAMLFAVISGLFWTYVCAFRHGNHSELKFEGLLDLEYAPRGHFMTKDARQYSDDWRAFEDFKPPTPGNVYRNTGFVKADGKSLTLNGRPWQFSGTNAFYAGLEYIMSEDELRHMMMEQEKYGTSVMRVFASFFERVPGSMMPEFGVYRESALRRLDLLLLEAAKRNIRVIIVLSNYWPFLGGMQKWVDMAYPNQGLPLETFYTDEFLRGEYKKFASQILNRRNTYTGILYKEDPSIFSYELANEPRTSHGFDAKIGRRPGATICDWVAEMSSFVKSQDSNHLLTIGDEGMRADIPPRQNDPRSWLNDGYEGADFTCNLQYADVATLHIYPDSWGFSADEFTWLGPNYLKDRRDIAWKQNKPVILEEYGMRRGYLASRNQYFGWVHQQVEALGFAGSLAWAASHQPREPYQYGYYGYNDGQGYVFGLSGDDVDGAESFVARNKYVKSIVEPERPCMDVPPDGSYTCKQQSAWGKCAESGGFMAVGTCDWSCGRCNQRARETVTDTERQKATVVDSGGGEAQASAQLSELIPAERSSGLVAGGGLLLSVLALQLAFFKY